MMISTFISCGRSGCCRPAAWVAIPFDHIGFSSLGAQSFMHGMFLSFSSIADINAFDAIICLILVLGLLREIGEKFGVHIVFILVACVLALFINPQYVNVSSIYSGTLMLLGLTYGTLLLTESLAAADSAGTIRAAVPCSLFFAALLSLKTTYVFVTPLFWVTGLAGSLLLIRERKQVLLAYFTSAVVSLPCCFPGSPFIWTGISKKFTILLKVSSIQASAAPAAAVLA